MGQRTASLLAQTCVRSLLPICAGLRHAKGLSQEDLAYEATLAGPSPCEPSSRHHGSYRRYCRPMWLQMFAVPKPGRSQAGMWAAVGSLQLGAAHLHTTFMLPL